MKGFPYRPGGYGGWPKWWQWLLALLFGATPAIIIEIYRALN